jgi:hypothetical protein
MRRAIILALSVIAISSLTGHAMAFQTGTIYVTKDGE